ncbi:hypothetical protein B0J12DRAFT_705968 [Macrophomina phaseolina]|uniref:Uncharacterized protein n=1 Tax=Macrophomina phaseolina TaxID=35725 RepID=A0ABQ8FQG8_9PEZI|nr:hypothetical protein B0J12DRAFT_705968 [Macrophomina phaseolina]
MATHEAEYIQPNLLVDELEPDPEGHVNLPPPPINWSVVLVSFIPGLTLLAFTHAPSLLLTRTTLADITLLPSDSWSAATPWLIPLALVHIFFCACLGGPPKWTVVGGFQQLVAFYMRRSNMPAWDKEMIGCAAVIIGGQFVALSLESVFGRCGWPDRPVEGLEESERIMREGGAAHGPGGGWELDLLVNVDDVEKGAIEDDMEGIEQPDRPEYGWEALREFIFWTPNEVPILATFVLMVTMTPPEIIERPCEFDPMAWKILINILGLGFIAVYYALVWSCLQGLVTLVCAWVVLADPPTWSRPIWFRGVLSPSWNWLEELKTLGRLGNKAYETHQELQAICAEYRCNKGTARIIRAKNMTRLKLEKNE